MIICDRCKKEKKPDYTYVQILHSELCRDCICDLEVWLKGDGYKPTVITLSKSSHIAVEKVNTRNLINCDVDPFIPEGWTVESHKKGGMLEWDPSKIELYLSEKQKTGWIKGEDLLKELEGKNVLNGCVLDYLLKHQELIPESWKEKFVYFFGTVYRDPSGGRRLLSLCWGDGGWSWDYRSLGGGFGASGLAASLAS